MKKYIFTITAVLFATISLLVFVRVSFAQESSEDKAKKFGVTFPVLELGNCTSVSECRTYCEDQTHRDACVNFAKKKGFYKEEEINSKRQSLMQAAKNELGCNLEESCKAICQQEANFEKCRAFAEKNGLEEGQKNPGDKKVLEKAKEILGCDSPSSCKAVCEQESNREKCSEFAKQTGLEGGKRRVGPGGCDSEDSCKLYCEKNQEECRKFGGGPPSDDKNRKKGPGGCDSEESCKKYCSEHPNECKGENKDVRDIKNDGKPGDDDKLRQMGPGGCNSEESCKKYCQEHPNECGNKDEPNQERLQRNLNEGPPEDFCKTNPDECRRKEIEKERKQFQPEERRMENKPPTENRPPENRIENNNELQPPEDVKGVSTEMAFFNKIINFLLGK